MATTLTTDGPNLLTASAATIYTTTGTLGFIIRGIRAVAVGGVDTWFSMSIGTAATGTYWAYQRQILANQEYDWSGFLFVPNGTNIQALAQATNQVVLFLSGTEES